MEVINKSTNASESGSNSSSLDEIEKINNYNIFNFQNSILLPNSSKFKNGNEPLSSEDVNAAINKLRDCKGDITIYLNTIGGYLHDAEKIVNAILEYDGKIDCYVFNNAMSSGTLIALACNRVFMNKYSFLGQIDPRNSSYFSSNYIVGIDTEQIETSWIRDLIYLRKGTAENNVERVRNLVEYISFVRKWDKDFKENVYNVLLEKKYGHDKPYSYKELSLFWNVNKPELVNGWTEKDTVLCNKYIQLLGPPKSDFFGSLRSSFFGGLF